MIIYKEDGDIIFADLKYIYFGDSELRFLFDEYRIEIGYDEINHIEAKIEENTASITSLTRHFNDVITKKIKLFKQDQIGDNYEN